MAALEPTFQQFEDVKVQNNTFGIHRVRLASASDTITVPTLADATTPANSVVELDDGRNDTGATVSASGANTVTITGGTVGGTVWFMTRHRGRINFAPEA